MKTSDASKGKSWMLVDDDWNLLRLTSMHLQNMTDREVVAFSSPVDALERMRSGAEAFEYVITDRHMPGTLGEEFLAMVCEINPSVKAVVITGDDTGLIGALERSALSATIVSKPFTSAELREAIADAPEIGDCRQAARSSDNWTVGRSDVSRGCQQVCGAVGRQRPDGL